VPSDDPVLLYEPKPGAGDVNAFGARDFPFDPAKPAGTFRIVVLGDSIGFGYCNDGEALAIADTFPKVLERALRARIGPNVQVVNLSVSGYDTLQEAEMLARKGLALDPDLVLIAYCLNDAWPASVEQMAFEAHGLDELLGHGAWFQALYLRSDLVRFVVQRTKIVSRGTRWLAREPDPDHTRAGFTRIARLGDEHRFTTVVAIFPLFEGFDPYPRSAEHEAAAARAQAAGFHALDLLPAFAAASHGNARALQGRCSREHPDERGHAVAADTIAAYLVAHGLVPAAAR
jgi:lysophospholipase L1-like esterase